MSWSKANLNIEGMESWNAFSNKDTKHRNLYCSFMVLRPILEKNSGSYLTKVKWKVPANTCLISQFFLHSSTTCTACTNFYPEPNFNTLKKRWNKVSPVQSHYWRQGLLCCLLWSGANQLFDLRDNMLCQHQLFTESAPKLLHFLVMYSDCPSADINVAFSLFEMLRNFHSSHRRQHPSMVLSVGVLFLQPAIDLIVQFSDLLFAWQHLTVSNS